MRIILLGNAGAGKSTTARRLIGNQDIPRLSLDEIAWTEGTQRRPLEESLTSASSLLVRFRQKVIEGIVLYEIAL